MWKKTQLNDGERGRSQGPLFIHEENTDSYNSLMTELMIVKGDNDSMWNSLNFCKQKLKEAETKTMGKKVREKALQERTV